MTGATDKARLAAITPLKPLTYRRLSDQEAWAHKAETRPSLESGYADYRGIAVSAVAVIQRLAVP